MNKTPSNLTVPKCPTEPVPNCEGAEFGWFFMTFTGIMTGIVAGCILGCLQRRTHSKYCWGYIGIPIPLDMLSVTKHRMVYTLIFGALADTVFEVITFSVPISGQTKVVASILNILLKILLVILILPVFYPLLAGVQAPIPLVGYVIGLLQTCIVIVTVLLEYYLAFGGCIGECSGQQGVQLAISILTVAFNFICLLLTLVWYVFRLIREIYMIVFKSKPVRGTTDIQNHITAYHFKRVKILLRPRHGAYNRRQKITMALYDYDPGFRYPVRFTIAMIISIYLVYKLFLYVLSIMITLSQIITKLRVLVLAGNFDWLGTLLQTASSNTSAEGFINSSITVFSAAKDTIQGGLLGSAVVLPMAPILSTLLCMVSIILTCRNVSDHLHKAARNDLSFFPKELPSNAIKLAAAIKYPGFQAAYMFWAWVIYTVIFTVGLLAIVVLCIALKYFYKVILDNAASLVVLLLYAQLVYWTEFLLCKFVFLARGEQAKHTLIINNRRLYHLFSYMWLFLNLFVGLFSAFKRIITSAVLSLLLVMRMDRVVLMKGFERFDFAHKTYIGFIYLDYIQNHSVVNTFVILLQQSLPRKDINITVINSEADTSQTKEKFYATSKYVLLQNYGENTGTNNAASGSSARVSKRAFNRWMVAYTLLKNEQLITMRGGHLDAVKNSLSLSEKLEQAEDGSHDSNAD